MKPEEELQAKLTKIADDSDAMLARIGIRLILRVQCIRCGAQFKEDELILMGQHLEMHEDLARRGQHDTINNK